ncbi:dihydroorotate dehydrogenase electron transfer subunit [Pelotomaculum isophthalicicum JI]|uniref:Dihydroorotate dehydrogenase B (NAD(+)), electron transfer subunit n=1 Tax=Pelotomaculum isophthalicicum JI TaxID=947010 RepID=A0A9X4JVV4_9FIRM|nr:dihydroorotate dehydrogenase electron transfer subunit [Pelotomaculum isophthalicicum]MDF9408038.1 dihydroorotate dehydrogenase electron transfer subunit [Pelotomaculum isophthalicicum JI]
MSPVADAKVIKQDKIAPGHFRLYLFAPEIAEAAKPGQFVHVRCGHTSDPLLRRPVSIHAVDREKGKVILFYRVAGKGTSLLSKNNRGDTISLLGPLGHGFSIPSRHARIFVVAGGIGIAPLYFFLQEIADSGTSADVFLGAATEKQLFFMNEIKESGHRVFPSTDDGSTGYHGTVTGLFEEYLRKSDNQSGPIRRGDDAKVYGCGPYGMLKRLTDIITTAGITGEVSLEERMGCGVGACLSCACKTRSGENGVQYRRACVEGPVFPAKEVVWE